MAYKNRDICSRKKIVSIGKTGGRSCNLGFTLVEVMCATVILIAGMASIYTAETASARTYASARHLSLATMLGSNMLEMSKILPPSDLLAMAQSSFSQDYDEKGNVLKQKSKASFYNLTMSTVSSTPTSLTILVTVSWSDGASGSQEKSVTMTGQFEQS